MVTFEDLFLVSVIFLLFTTACMGVIFFVINKLINNNNQLCQIVDSHSATIETLKKYIELNNSLAVGDNELAEKIEKEINDLNTKH